MSSKPPHPGIRGPEGYMLLGALVLVAVLAISLTVVAREWSFVHRRAMEEELKFRGERIMRAILEYQYLQAKGGKPQLQIANYESLEKALTDQPNPILPGIPPDPLTARYDERGERIEGTGQWGLVVPGGTAASRRPDPFSRQRQQQGQQGQVFGRAVQVIGCEGRGRAGRSMGPGGRSSRGPTGAVRVLGVASCLDDPDLKPIGLSPQGEEAGTYRDWLFVPPGALQMGRARGGQQQQQATWQANWPGSLPAPPFPAGVTAPGAGRPRNLPGVQRPGSTRGGFGGSRTGSEQRRP